LLDILQHNKHPRGPFFPGQPQESALRFKLDITLHITKLGVVLLQPAAELLHEKYQAAAS
jgi:hypothetical protein